MSMDYLDIDNPHEDTNYEAELADLNEDYDGVPTVDKKFMAVWGMDDFCTKDPNKPDIKVVGFSSFGEGTGYDNMDRAKLNKIAIGGCWNSADDNPQSVYTTHSIIRIK